jgi:hypothetical protein
VEFKRRRRFDTPGGNIFVVAPEDLILSKLLWAKEAESDLQRNDAQAIVESAADLDWPYLDKWAVSLDVADMLDELKNL